MLSRLHLKFVKSGPLHESIEKRRWTYNRRYVFYVFVHVNIIKKTVCLYLFIIFKIKFLNLRFSFDKQPNFINPRPHICVKEEKLRSNYTGWDSTFWESLIYFYIHTNSNSLLEIIKKAEMKNSVIYKKTNVYYLVFCNES